MSALLRCLTFALLAASVASSQTLPAAIQVNTIYAGADGKFEAAPDTAVLQFTISAQQDTSRNAYDRAAAATERVRQILKANGIDPKAAQISFYSVQPMYDYKNPKQRVIGFRVTASVSLKLHDFSKVGGIIEQTADIEDTQNQSLTYTLEDVEPAKAKAAEDALKKARNHAAAVAMAGGRTLGELLYASVDVNQPVILAQPMVQRAMMGATASAPPPNAEFTPQSVTINAHVNAMFALK
jgi:uncharacterized protein